MARAKDLALAQQKEAQQAAREQRRLAVAVERAKKEAAAAAEAEAEAEEEAEDEAEGGAEGEAEGESEAPTQRRSGRNRVILKAKLTTGGRAPRKNLTTKAVCFLLQNAFLKQSFPLFQNQVNLIPHM